MLTKLVGSLVRHGIGWTAGALAATQVPQFMALSLWLSEGVGVVVAAVVTGVAMLFPLVWSFWDKFRK
ncbi:MAG: hypothetical protein ACPG5L_07485 [Vibrio gallaecicus]